MIYRIVLDGQDIYDSFYRTKAIYLPQLETELNTAGSLSFSIQRDHEFYNQIQFFKSDIEVYEDGDLIWFGRPVEQQCNFRNQKDIYCEGALAFFNDSVQMPSEHRGTLHEYFRKLINQHNSQVDSNRQFTIGEITIPDKYIYRKSSYEKTLNVIKDKCLEAEGGYLFCRKENGQLYIDWLKDLPYTTNQPIEFGLNMLDLQSSFDGTDFATCIIPLGQTDSETGEELTIASVNNGSVRYESDAVELYGRITAVQNFNYIDDATTLLQAAKTWLENTQFNSLTMECTAADLHVQNENYEIFKLGQIVHCFSNPHLLDKDLPLSKMSLSLDTAVKKITLGTIPKKSLTNFYKEDSYQDLQKQIGDLSDYVGYTPDWDIPEYIYDPEMDPEDPWYPDYPEYEFPSLDDRFTDLEDDYGDLRNDLDDLNDYLGYGDNPEGENILNNLEDRISNLEKNPSSGGGSGYYYPKIWIGTEAQYLNNDANYVKTLDTAPIAGKSYYTFDKSTPAYKEYVGDHFDAGTQYYERYSPNEDMIISFIVDELPDETKHGNKKVPGGWEVDSTTDTESEDDNNDNT